MQLESTGRKKWYI